MKINPSKIYLKKNLSKICILLCCVLYASMLDLSACMHLEIFVCTYICVHVRILVSVIYHPVLFSSSCWIIFFTIWSLLSWTSWVKRVAWLAVYATKCQYTWQVLCVAAGISFNYFFLMSYMFGSDLISFSLIKAKLFRKLISIL